MDAGELKRLQRNHSLDRLILALVETGFKGMARAVIKTVRLKRRNEPVPAGREPETIAKLPTGPYKTTRRSQVADLLLFVPRGLNSFFIDDMTGGYGYSHAAVDCGEVDEPTGKAVMIESTVGRTVERTFVDQYGPRPFVRIRLTKAGITPEPYCERVKSKLGQPYDNLEALTWGQIDDPAKQVCSDLAAVSLPEAVREDIARASRLFLLRRHAVSVHSRPEEHGVREFISPNGFAEYFGAPKGGNVKGPDQLVIPHVVTSSPGRAVVHVVRSRYWEFGLAAGVVTLIGLFLWRK